MPFCDSPDDQKSLQERGTKETQDQMYERAKQSLTSTKPSDDDELWRNMFFVMSARRSDGIRSHHSARERRAVKAAGKWKFKPGPRLGRPVPVLVTMEITFAIR